MRHRLVVRRTSGRTGRDEASLLDLSLYHLIHAAPGARHRWERTRLGNRRPCFLEQVAADALPARPDGHRDERAAQDARDHGPAAEPVSSATATGPAVVRPRAVHLRDAARRLLEGGQDGCHVGSTERLVDPHAFADGHLRDVSVSDEPPQGHGSDTQRTGGPRGGDHVPRRSLRPGKPAYRGCVDQELA